ncbi:TetR/AcrR family transcriptional regulator [Risungbinella massiliensis]|uniref:TetR/AcrR family transcriptional regulator n=1 Tax=Risungbinella massiliensis TaxID=1329796 RepID=UPI0005CB913E|nr:TetR/AcrR family transcriptional regulator [Risungbinella massiliensis]
MLRHPKIEGIFQAAVEVFSHSGFDQAKVDEIAQKAGVAKGTIYYHFRSKEELFLGMISEGLEKLVDFVERNIQTSDDPIVQLEQVVRAQLLFFSENAKLAKIILQEAFGTKERQQEFRHHVRDYLRLIEGLLEKGQAQGVFRVANVSEMASAIFGALSVSALQKIFSLEGDALQTDQALVILSDSMVHFVLGGIKMS